MTNRPRRKARATSERKIKSYTHDDKERTNNPPIGLVNANTDLDVKPTKYDHDPHVDPNIDWAGKSEGTSFEVPTVSLHVHERIDPCSIVESVRKPKHGDKQIPLFGAFDDNPPLREAIEFYKHRHNWSNRLIVGDSLLVMNSLLEKEGLGGQVQTVYIDPPYGIKYGSNFQPFIGKRSVQDGKPSDLTQEPEMIRAFRDTWELGIHSYLTFLRDRLTLAQHLLTQSGSCFVQIGDENVHRVALLMDEIFGAQNRVATITFATTSGSRTKTLPEVADYLLWYARDKELVKYRQLYEPLDRHELVRFFSSYAMIELEDGTARKLTEEESENPAKYLPQNARLFKRQPLTSQGEGSDGPSRPFSWAGRDFDCPQGERWRVTREGLEHLAEIDRLSALPNSRALMWKLYEEEVPGRRIHNVWPDQVRDFGKQYVVQTAQKVVKRCILMTSDPGDLVFDPTCGSGTTAYVAEQWGRRWITCDTSRVAAFVARQRLMTANFDYYELAQESEGVGSGFRYQTVPKVSASILAYDQPKRETTIYDLPIRDSNIKRVSGPFTVEAVPSLTVLPFSMNNHESVELGDSTLSRKGQTVQVRDWIDELSKTGIRGKLGQRFEFARLEPFPGKRYIHADGESRVSSPNTRREGEHDSPIETSERIVVTFGPNHAPLEPRQVELALEEAQELKPTPRFIVFAAFQFDPEAAKDIEETNWPGITLLKAQMNADLLTGDLKKKRASNESFWLIGQPDIELERVAEAGRNDKFRVAVLGFDYYNTISGTVESGGAEKIAAWMLDTDYDGRSLFPRQVFFPMADSKGGWNRLAKTLRAQLDLDRISKFHGTQSLPFERGDHARVAVKIVDDRGIESLRVVNLPTDLDTREGGSER